MATMGLSLIFGVLKVVNVGHGAFIMVGAYVALILFQTLGIAPPLAVPVALILGMALGMLFYYTAIKKLLKGPELASLLATFSIGVILEEVCKQLFTSEARGYHWGLDKLDLGFTVLPLQQAHRFRRQYPGRPASLSVVSQDPGRHGHAQRRRGR